MITEINQAIEAAFLKAEAAFGRKFDRARVSTDIRSGSNRAGDACIRTRTIRINREIYRRNPTHVLSETCPHEVAHLIAVDLYGIGAWNHGPHWKHVMRKLGKDPSRCHNLITQSFLKRPIYQCNCCNKQIEVSPATHGRLIQGKSILKPCKCRGKFSYAGRGYELLRENKVTCRTAIENPRPARNVA